MKVKTMSLLAKENEKNSAAASGAAPAFEEEGATVATTETKAAADVKVQAAASTAVAVPVKGSGLVVAGAMKTLDAYKDALTVDYNTLTQIIANQGNFMDRETKTVLGDTIVFQLLSYQAAFVISPGDDNAPDDIVRYSNDGKTCTDGVDVQEYLAEIKKDWPKAALKERVVVVGAIETASKTDKYNGTLVQFDLSPASRTLWNRYKANAAYGLATKRYTEETVGRIKTVTEIKTRGNDSFTQASFEVAA